MTTRWKVVVALLLVLACAVTFKIKHVSATGSLSVPNTIAAQPAGNLQASVLDANWTAVVNYVNAREITQDILANRPAAGTAGRYYFATDENGGTMYADTGAAWTQLTSGVSAAGAGGPGSRGLSWATATATNTQYNGTADLVMLRNPSTGTIVTRQATTTVTNNILATSPAVNARDTASSFSVSTWIHFYYIWNGSTLGSLSSNCSPETTTGACDVNGGPVLPSTYTHWAYIGPVRLATAGTLNATYIRNSYAALEPVNIRAVGTGPAAEISLDVAFLVPPNHKGVMIDLMASRCDLTAEVRGLASGPALLRSFAGGTAASCGMSGLVPLGAQTVYFIGNATGGQGLQVRGYAIPNGGS